MYHRIDELRTLLREEPDSRRFFLLGDLLRKAGELDEAETVLTKGLEHHPKYVAARMSLGRIQLDRAQFSEAERSFARALELDPENAVAARLIGETAERVGESVRAIKAYKLARALMPGDADIQARIEAIERQLAGGPEEFPPQPVEEPFAAEPPAFPDGGVEVRPVTPPEPFPVDEPSPDDSEPFGHAVSPSRPRELISVSEDDPFAVISTGDTGVWMVADDVFAPPAPIFDRTADDVFGMDPVSEPEHEPEFVPEPVPEPLSVPEHGHEFAPAPEPEPEPGLRSRPSEEKEGRRGEAKGGAGPIGYESGRELRPGRPPEFEAVPEPVAELIPEPEPEFVPEPIPEYSQELPLPTVTLARLAQDQGDRPLALETLKAVLDLDPENREAGEMLELLSRDPSPEISQSPSPEISISPADLLAAKSARLKGWMEDIRSATERRAP